MNKFNLGVGINNKNIINFKNKIKLCYILHIVLISIFGLNYQGLHLFLDYSI